MSVLKLQDDIDTIDFITDANGTWQLLDGTFSAPPPDALDIRASRSQNRIIGRQWKNRTITFEYRCNDSIVAGAATPDAMIRVSRMLMRAASQVYLDGGSFTGYANSNDIFTGDNGVVLKMRLGAASLDSYTDESGATVTDTRILTARVVAGRQEILQPYSVASQLDESVGNRHQMRVKVELECEPFLLGDPRMLFYEGAPGLCSTPEFQVDYDNNKIVLDGSYIPGDVPALTRISTELSDAYGIIMGRHAGTALTNSPGPTQFFGTGRDDIVVSGNVETTGESFWRVKIVAVDAGGDTIKWSGDDGSTWSSDIVLENHKEYVILDSPSQNTKISFMFMRKTGHVLDDYWRWKVGQTYLINDPAVWPAVQFGIGQTNTQAAAYATLGGYALGAVYFNICKGVAGKYKVLAQYEITQDYQPEFYMRLNYAGISSAGVAYYSGNTAFNWVRAYKGNKVGIVDLGTIDFSAAAVPSRGHDNGHSEGKIQIFIRGQHLASSDYTAYISRVMICPAQDNEGFLWAGWSAKGEGREVYCNFDHRNPYIAEVSANIIDTDAAYTDDGDDSIYTDPEDLDLEIVRVVMKEESHIGNILTLHPGVTNTVVMSPVMTGNGSASNEDFRSSYFKDDVYTGPVSIAIRPRYLLLSEV